GGARGGRGGRGGRGRRGGGVGWGGWGGEPPGGGLVRGPPPPPPLLRLLRAPNFVVDLAGPTSTGKTTVLRLAASVWGEPSGSGESVMWTWNSTAAWRGRAPGMLHGRPPVPDQSQGGGQAQACP